MKTNRFSAVFSCSLLLGALIFSLAEMSCTRKGEDDPLLSLRSRQARVVGKWKAVSGTALSDYNQFLYSSGLWVYDGETEILTDGFRYVERNRIRYTTEVEFTRDNRFEWVIAHTDSNGINQRAVLSGSWDFTTRSKDGTKKTELLLRPNKTTGVWPSNYNWTFPSRERIPVFTIRELRNSRMVIHRSYETPDQLTNPTVDIVSYYEEWILEPR